MTYSNSSFDVYPNFPRQMGLKSFTEKNTNNMGFLKQFPKHTQFQNGSENLITTFLCCFSACRNDFISNSRQ